MNEYINYEIKIDYPLYANENFNEKIKNYLEEQKNNFENAIKGYEDLKDYDFYVNYMQDVYKNIESIHFTIFAYTGGAHYIRMDNIFYYDQNKNKELQISNILNNNKEFYETISKLSKTKLKETKKELIFDDETFEEGLKPTEENFKYLIFTNEGLKIIFPPYQVGPWSSGAIDITISYEEVKSYLKL